MKIGFFTTTYLPISYGSVTSINNFRDGLEKLGHEVHVFTPRFADYKDRLSNVHRTPSIMYGYKIKYPLGIPVWNGMCKELDELGLDVFHCHQPFSICQAAVNYAKNKGIPTIFTHHCKYEDYVHYIPAFLPRKLFAEYTKKTATKFANKSDYVITPSDSVRRLIRSRGVTSPVRILPTGVDWNRFQKGNKKETRQKLNIRIDEIVLVSNGRIDEEKNIMFLVRSIFPFLTKNRNVKIVFVGDGSLRGKVEEIAKKKKIEDQVIMTGFVPQQEIQDYYSGGDIFVQASLTETQGISLLEALASGMGVVAVEASGAVDQIINGKTGILTEHKEDVFRKAVEKLVKQEKLRSFLGEAGREYGKSCDMSQQARQLEKIYLELIEKKIK